MNHTQFLRQWPLIAATLILVSGGLAAFASTVRSPEKAPRQDSAETSRPAGNLENLTVPISRVESLPEADLPPSVSQRSEGKGVIPLDANTYPLEEDPEHSLAQGDIDDSGAFAEREPASFWPYLWEAFSIPNGYYTPFALSGTGASGSGSGFSSRVAVPPSRAELPPSS
jgi:hypothetical protein